MPMSGPNAPGIGDPGAIGNDASEIELDPV